jgi:poly(ADP-ribose) glycohydrolase ARH3
VSRPPSGAAQGRLDAARGALLGTFVGDALGMPYEGSSPERVPERVEMVEARLGRGTYTDDTEMMIALAESLRDRGRVEAEPLAQAFLAAHRPERGYGAGTLAVFGLWRAGVSVDEAALRALPGGSYGNGAAMRVAPVGVLFAQDPERLRVEAERSARVTHAHPLGVDACVVQATAVGAAVRGEEILSAVRSATDDLAERLERVAELLEGSVVSPAQAAATLGSSSAGPESVPLAVYAALSHRSFAEAAGFAVRCGGDTDTVAAMSGAIAGARDGAGAIPARWLHALEAGPRGRGHVEELAAALASAAGEADADDRGPPEPTAGRPGSPRSDASATSPGFRATSGDLKTPLRSRGFPP